MLGLFWILALGPAWSQVEMVEVRAVGAWTVFKNKGAVAVCGIAAMATKSSHKRGGSTVSVRRNPGQVYMTYRKDAPGTAQFGYWAGFPMAKDEKVSATIDGTNFPMYLDPTGQHPEWAWVTGELDERIENSMKRGSNLVVRSTSRRGTSVEDSFSLSGVTKGLQSAKQECR